MNSEIKYLFFTFLCILTTKTICYPTVQRNKKSHARKNSLLKYIKLIPHTWNPSLCDGWSVLVWCADASVLIWCDDASVLIWCDNGSAMIWCIDGSALIWCDNGSALVWCDDGSPRCEWENGIWKLSETHERNHKQYT